MSEGFDSPPLGSRSPRPCTLLEHSSRSLPNTHASSLQPLSRKYSSEIRSISFAPPHSSPRTFSSSKAVDWPKASSPQANHSLLPNHNNSVFPYYIYNHLLFIIFILYINTFVLSLYYFYFQYCKYSL